MNSAINTIKLEGPTYPENAESFFKVSGKYLVTLTGIYRFLNDNGIGNSHPIVSLTNQLFYWNFPLRKILRPEIEEDYRQIKDFWKIEDFKSTKYNFITFHVVMVLLGYLFFSCLRKQLKVINALVKASQLQLKTMQWTDPETVIIYSGQYFGIFGFLEFIQLYSSCGTEVKECLDPILAKV